MAAGNFASEIARNAARHFALPPGSSDDLVAYYESEAFLTRENFPPPDPIAEACHAALFDPKPLHRYLVVPNEQEAELTLAKAAREWAQLNESTPHRWSFERLRAEVESVAADD